jgi:integrase
MFRELLPHLAEMALFAVNTGCRDGEICRLRWEWEVKVPALCTSVFIIPGRYVKNADDRLVVLNRFAASLAEGLRGKHSTHVFSYRGKPVTRMLNSAWMRARKKADLKQVRVHDLKHSSGRRLSAVRSRSSQPTRSAMPEVKHPDTAFNTPLNATQPTPSESQNKCRAVAIQVSRNTSLT